VTPGLARRVVDYCQLTTEQSYLVWAGDALALHLGFGDGGGTNDRAALDASLLEMNAQLAKAGLISQGTRVLDAGCGVGGSSIWLERQLGALVTGVTLDPKQVELARGFASRLGARKARFGCADFTNSGLEQASFDVVWNLESLCHVADVASYLAQVRTLLAPDGRFVCGDFFRGRGGAQCDAMCAGWVLPALLTPLELASQLINAGFEDVQVRDLTPDVQTSARWMGTTATFELLRLGMQEATGAPPSPALEAHYTAAVGAAGGLASGEVVWSLVTARSASSCH
jgi:tocopherol O-methyltransferase